LLGLPEGRQEPLVPFTLKTANCITLGTFNIYVIQPRWLKDVGLLPAEVEGVMLEADFTEPGIRMKLPDVTWRVEPVRITVEATRASVDCGQKMRVIFDKLPWTPIKAMGINAIYEAPLEEFSDYADRWVHPARKAELPPECTLHSRTWHTAVSISHHTLNLQVTIEDDRIQIASNIHTDLRYASSEFAAQVASEYHRLQKKAASLIHNVYDLSVPYDIDDRGNIS
jgi:hypothetical protein